MVLTLHPPVKFLTVAAKSLTSILTLIFERLVVYIFVRLGRLRVNKTPTCKRTNFRQTEKIRVGRVNQAL